MCLTIVIIIAMLALWWYWDAIIVIVMPNIGLLVIRIAQKLSGEE
jgi:hypothetical protein